MGKVNDMDEQELMQAIHDTIKAQDIEIDELKGFIREAYFAGVFTDEPALEEKAEGFI